MLMPLNFNQNSSGTALVQLKEKGGIDTPDDKYKSYTQGIVISLSSDVPPNTGELIGKQVYFEQFMDSAQTMVDGNNYAFIAMENIKGVDSLE